MTEVLVVVLATRNGERFVERQLGSIAGQTRVPDALVVSDDGSTDATAALCRSFAKSVSFPVTVLEPDHLDDHVSAVDRVSAAFSRGFGVVADATLVAFSDQDDIWFADKLERSCRALADNPAATFVCGDAELMDELGDPLPGRLSDRWPLPSAWDDLPHAQQLRVALRNPFATGATMVVRSTLLDAALPVPTGWLHDRWLSVAGCALGGSVALRQPVMRYRVHASQAWGLDDEPEGERARHHSTLRRAGELGRKALQLRNRLGAMPLPPDIRTELRWRSLVSSRPLSGRGPGASA